ncbi:MAG TPA: type II 3-dehydroquinate dehydratase [Clostridiales bacterium]|nr:type II 3-dehydroquinate dehydratase [Clostridiales bacterium]
MSELPKTSARLLLLNGPNLNMLGRRDPKQYGTFTLADVEELTRRTAAGFGYGLDCFQSNHEGDLVDRIQAAIGQYAGILINAGALTHYSYALRDAIELCGLPVMEIHISDIYKREPFRHLSVIHPVCCGQVVGLGLDSYRLGTEQLCQVLKGQS